MNIAMPLNHTVPITAFNRGKAGQIFSSVKQIGMTVVMKNNEAECVLLSPQRYNDLMERIENAELLAVAHERLRNFDPETSSTVSFEEICAKEKINLATSTDDVEIL